MLIIAESALRRDEIQQGFPILLLQLVQDSSQPIPTRQAAALYFKNYVRRNWPQFEGEADKVAPADREQIKASIIDLLVTLPTNLQVQLEEAVSIISDNDFPDNWQNLIDVLVAKLSPTDFAVNNAVLGTAHSIFRRWRPQFRSNALFIEIKYVLERFQTPYLELFKRTDQLVDENTNNKAQLTILGNTLVLLTKIFYDLNCQDLPEFFEEHMDEFMSLLHKYLTYRSPLLVSDDDEAGPIEKLRASICEIAILYTQRDLEEFKMLPKFVETVWTLLTSTGPEPKYDLLISKAMSFLTIVVKMPGNKGLFSDPATLSQLCERVVIPNMTLRESDEELFEDDPIEYIRRDLEGADHETRRYAATQFVHGLMYHFREAVTNIISQHITHNLQEYARAPANNYRYKDSAIYLLTSIASQSEATARGLTATNDLVNVTEFFTQNVVSDLQNTNVHPILKVDAVKYLNTFRNQLTKEQLLAVFPLLVSAVTNANYVVQTYASIAIERILFLKRDGVMTFSQTDIRPYVEPLLKNLFALIESAETPEKLAENDYLMKAIMRVIITARGDAAPYASFIIQHLTAILSQISRNPSNPKFNHYVFEALGGLIRFITAQEPATLAEFENSLMGPFQMILGNDVAEFTPYVFQLLSQMLVLHRVDDLSDNYKVLLTPLLSPSLWEMRGNIPALTNLLQAFTARGPSLIISEGKLEPLFGVFQKLISSRLNDQYGFDLVQSITLNLPFNNVKPFLPAVLNLLMQRLQRSRTDKFTHCFVYFVFYLVCLEKEGMSADTIVETFDNIQPGIFGQILSAVVLPEVQRMHGRIERKVVAVGMAKLLTQSDRILSTGYVSLWTDVLTALLKFFILPQDLTQAVGARIEEEDAIADLDYEERGEGFQSSFAKLATAVAAPVDVSASVGDPKEFLARGLAAQSHKHPGQLGPLIQAHIASDLSGQLLAYMQSVGVGLE